MHVFPVKDPQTGVQLIIFILSFIMGLSHLVQPRMWTEFFQALVARGKTGLILNNFLALIPAATIVALHQVWSGPALAITIYGWLLLIKASIGFLVPDLGMRSLRLSQHGAKGFMAGGIGLLVIAGFAAAALWQGASS